MIQQQQERRCGVILWHGKSCDVDTAAATCAIDAHTEASGDFHTTRQQTLEWLTKHLHQEDRGHATEDSREGNNSAAPSTGAERRPVAHASSTLRNDNGGQLTSEEKREKGSIAIRLYKGTIPRRLFAII